MKITRAISTVEVHTGGEPFRIITSGYPRVPGDTILARRKWLGENTDELRQALMFEPRGHADMYGGLLTEPVSEGADFGIIFMHNVGYSDHCGHGVIALSTAAVELGWVQRTLPETRVGIDAPCGFIEAFVTWDGEHAGGVRFRNVPSFLWKRDVTVQTASFGAVTGDIAYGGAFYIYVDASAFVPVPPVAWPNCMLEASFPKEEPSSTNRSSDRFSKAVSCQVPKSANSTPSFPKCREMPSFAALPTGFWTVAIRRLRVSWCDDQCPLKVHTTH